MQRELEAGRRDQAEAISATVSLRAIQSEAIAELIYMLNA